MTLATPTYECPFCGEATERIYRCDTCGKDLADVDLDQVGGMA